MNKIFQRYLRKYVAVFFDDILVYSKNMQDHVQHLTQVLEALLYAKLSKCIFCQHEMEYLGHIITKEGVMADPKKIIAVTEWPIPANLKQLRGFLELTRYYRKFIRGHALIAQPMTELLKKNAFS